MISVSLSSFLCDVWGIGRKRGTDCLKGKSQNLMIISGHIRWTVDGVIKFIVSLNFDNKWTKTKILKDSYISVWTIIPSSEGVANGKYEPLRDGEISVFHCETDTFCCLWIARPRLRVQNGFAKRPKKFEIARRSEPLKKQDCETLEISLKFCETFTFLDTICHPYQSINAYKLEASKVTQGILRKTGRGVWRHDEFTQSIVHLVSP